MKFAYSILINDLLQQYHFKNENMRAATAIAEEVRQFSQNDYAFRLSVGLEGLLSTAQAAGDTESAAILDALVSQCSSGSIPQPIFMEDDLTEAFRKGAADLRTRVELERYTLEFLLKSQQSQMVS
ncbi:hypothetical protein [Serratia bockelmannii]|uniref:hypothetical protein n=1 Tax=Serratia bockelmannii TaxID=2703793 RepID=UPI003F6BE348